MIIHGVVRTLSKLVPTPMDIVVAADTCAKWIMALNWALEMGHYEIITWVGFSTASQSVPLDLLLPYAGANARLSGTPKRIACGVLSGNLWGP